MSKKCLVTSGLISAVDWYKTAPESIIKPERGGDGETTWKQKALTDLYNTINRVKTPYSQEALNGIEFEKAVYKLANTEKIGGTDKFKKVCESVKGYAFYQKAGINEQIGPHECYIYGKFDAMDLKNDKITDIKTTGNYSPGKYLETFQHKLYCYILGVKYFTYLIIEWHEFPEIKNIWEENYEAPDRDGVLIDEFKTEIHNKILCTFEVIKELELWESYKEKFCLY